MNKAALIAAIASSTGQTKAIAENFLGALEVLACNTLRVGDELILPGIGKLTPVKKAARTARNPRTGEKIEKPATTVVKFRVASALKTLVA